METAQSKGFSANTLKCLAMATMFIDHFAYLIAPNRGPLYGALHFIGSVTAPILFILSRWGTATRATPTNTPCA